jgi:hypothetical protein
LKNNAFASDYFSGSTQAMPQLKNGSLLEIKQNKIRSTQGADVKFSGETDD